MAVVSYYKVGGGGLTVVVRLAAKNNALGSIGFGVASVAGWRRGRMSSRGGVCVLEEIYTGRGREASRRWPSCVTSSQLVCVNIQARARTRETAAPSNLYTTATPILEEPVTPTVDTWRSRTLGNWTTTGTISLTRLQSFHRDSCVAHGSPESRLWRTVHSHMPPISRYCTSGRIRLKVSRLNWSIKRVITWS